MCTRYILRATRTEKHDTEVVQVDLTTFLRLNAGLTARMSSAGTASVYSTNHFGMLDPCDTRAGHIVDSCDCSTFGATGCMTMIACQVIHTLHNDGILKVSWQAPDLEVHGNISPIAPHVPRELDFDSPSTYFSLLPFLNLVFRPKWRPAYAGQCHAGAVASCTNGVDSL